MDFEDFALLLLDTLDENHAAKGLFCGRRLAWLGEEIERRSRKRILLFMHHPPRSVGVPWFDQMLLEEPEGFLFLVKEFPAIEHIAFGHLHLTTTGHWDRVSFSSNRGTCHRVAMGFSATAIDFIKSEPAYDVILVEDGGVTVHHTAPIENVSRLAREHATPDGKGRMEYLDE